MRSPWSSLSWRADIFTLFYMSGRHCTPCLIDMLTSQVRRELQRTWGFPDDLASFPCTWQKAWWLWLQHVETYFPGIRILDVGGFWGLLSNLAAPGWLPAPCALGAARCRSLWGSMSAFPAGRQWEGQSASVSSSGKQTLETSSRFQPPCPWLALCKTPLPGSGEGAADVRNKQYFAFFRIKITFLGWLNFEGKVVCPAL